MLGTLGGALLAGLALQQQTDTTIAVRAGMRVDVNNYGGSVVVDAWDRSAVRVRAEHSGRDRVAIGMSGSVLSVRSEGRMGPSRVVDYHLTIPRGMGVTVSGVYNDITLDGAGDIGAETVEGDVTVTGGSGSATLSSIEGEIVVRDRQGRLKITAVDGDVEIRNLTGDLVVESVDGDVIMTGIQATTVDVNSVDGDLHYEGTLRDNGKYRLGTHDGDILLAVPERTNASVTVAMFSGDFDSCFPIQLQSTSKHRFRFTMGSGSAQVELESFDGTIRLCRPGQLPTNRRDHDRNKNKNQDCDHCREDPS